ncbi:unnamed protein product [Peronospora belbahrii]|uniref:Uncharacterized protein n=1 Tax=Peronospora belbahrii TaxID=622444 RepID=A0ABN8CUB7_9STRA|nr:unnamed protein product [Peronospora belbahrii]
MSFAISRVSLETLTRPYESLKASPNRSALGTFERTIWDDGVDDLNSASVHEKLIENKAAEKSTPDLPADHRPIGVVKFLDPRDGLFARSSAFLDFSKLIKPSPNSFWNPIDYWVASCR